jgi:hypothetical protein
MFTWWAPWRNQRHTQTSGGGIRLRAGQRIAGRDGRVRRVARREFGTSDHWRPLVAVFDRVNIMKLRVRIIVAFFLFSIVPLGAVTLLLVQPATREALREAAGHEAELLADELGPAHADRHGAAQRTRSNT